MPHQQREEMSDRGSARSGGAAQRSRPAGATTPPYPNYEMSARRSSDGVLGELQRLANYIVRIVHRIVPPGGILSGAFNMASASIGAGILGLPAASDSAGLAMAMIYLLVITYFSVFSMYILALAAQSTRIKSFEGMARWLFPYGNYTFSYAAAFIRWFHSFAACVAYVISLGDCFSAIFDGALKQHPDNAAISFLASKPGNRMLVVVVWFCVMVPLIVPKHIDSLRYASAIAISFMVYFVIVVVVHSCRHGLPENIHHVELVGDQVNDNALEFNTVFLFRTGNSVVHTVGVFTFAYVCQINSMEVFWDFRSEIRTAKNYTWAALLGMLLCGTLYVLVCVFGYLDFGSKQLLGKSLLLMFDPLSEADVMIAYVGVLVKLCVAYALLMMAARNSLYYLIGFQHRYRNRPADATTVAAATGLPPSEKSLDDILKPLPPPLPLPAESSAAATTELDGDTLVDTDGMAKKMPGSPDVFSATMEVDEPEASFAENTAEDTTYVDNIPFWQHLTVVAVLAVASLLLGMFIPNINTVFGFAGSISGACMAFIFPSLFFMYSGNFTVSQVGWFTYLNTYALLICGVIGIVFGTGGTIYETI